MLRRRSTSRNARASSTVTGGATSSGSWITCASFLHSVPRRDLRITSINLVPCLFNLDPWTKYVLNSWIGAIEHNSHSGLMWNLALDGSGDPKLPGTNSCGGPGCRGIVTINSDGSYELNEECEFPLLRTWMTPKVTIRVGCADYSMAQASRAILPRDSGGEVLTSFSCRIGDSGAKDRH